MATDSSLPPGRTGYPFQTSFSKARDYTDGSLNVFVVEDNPTDVWIVDRALHDEGIDAHLFVASEVDEAIALLDRIDSNQISCPQLFVLDLNLPKRSGFDVLERVRSSPRCCRKPVAIFTSSSALSDRTQAARLGANLYILKPSELKDIPAVGKQLRQALAAG
jgi:CheY-like chemotaxis protein